MSTSGQSSSEPPKRQRKVHPKTRTGCKTCKIRKVKCDEAKPFCNRCTSTGRKCDGYPSADPIRHTPSRSVTPPSNTLAGPSSLVLSIPGTNAEKRSFQFFITNTAAELAGYYNEEFWKEFVLKASLGSNEGVAALRHAVVGIAALHEEFLNDGQAETGYGVENGFAVAQYSKAITHLRQTLTTTNVSASPLIALMSSALFVSFNTLRGSTGSAMVHLQSGLKILKDARVKIRAQRESGLAGSGKAMSQEEEYIMEKYIAPLLVRLSVQAILYLDTRGIEEKMVMARALGGVNDRVASEADVYVHTTATNATWVFDSLEHAREMMNLTAEAHFRTIFLCDPRLPWSKQTPEVMALNSKALEYLAKWTDAFSAWMTIHTPTLTTAQIRGATVIKVHASVIEIMHESIKAGLNEIRPIALATNVAAAFAKPKIIELFATVVTLCRSLVNAVEAEPPNEETGQKRNVFSADLGIVGPLYYVATKCTVPSMRDEALALLKRWKGREGMWDSSMGIRMATEFWEVESKFGKRGYDAYEEQTKSTEQNKEKRNRGNVSLELDGQGRWKWKVSLDLEMADARATAVQHTPATETGGASMDFDMNTLDLSNFDSNLDSMFDREATLPFQLDPELQFGQPLYSSTSSVDDWMSMLYFQGQGDHQYLPTFALQDYGNGAGVEMDEVDFQLPGNVSTPGSYTNTSESATSNWDDLLCGGH